MATYSSIKYNFTPPDATTSSPWGAGAMKLIKTINASSDSTINFVDGSSDVVLDNTYRTYLFKLIEIHPQTDDKRINLGFSTDGGSNYNATVQNTFFIAHHNEGDSSSGLQYQTASDNTLVSGAINYSEGIGNENDQNASGELWLFNPSDTTYMTHFMGRCARMYPGDDSFVDDFVGGYVNTTSAVDAIQFSMTSGNMDSGTIKLYGIA
jgi:hypothetical protein|tara:strand:+ start:1141 stop:1767 length:627 start_codon:yes stop_codon:yes gene_type:complete